MFIESAGRTDPCQKSGQYPPRLAVSVSPGLPVESFAQEAAAMLRLAVPASEFHNLTLKVHKTSIGLQFIRKRSQVGRMF